jgi:ribonuclease HII
MVCPLTGLIGGIDEAGRGPLAGPVVSSCVLWMGSPENKNGVNDSKLLTEKERTALFPWITEHAYSVGVGIATSKEVDEMNILNASLLSMDRALHNAGITALPDLLLIDGNHGISSFPDGKPVVKGDRKCFYIACASIIAKVIRDSIMEVYDFLYPPYNFRQHKGYPTPAHKRAIQKYGPSPIHRMTFRGVREYGAI